MTITRKSAKAKCRRLQNKVAESISKMLNIPWGKDELIRARELGQSGVDVVLLGEAFELFKYSIECKATEKWDVPGAIRQAKSNQKEGTDWMVIMRRSNEKPVVMLDYDAFFRLYIDYLTWTEGNDIKPNAEDN